MNGPENGFQVRKRRRIWLWWLADFLLGFWSVGFLWGAIENLWLSGNPGGGPADQHRLKALAMRADVYGFLSLVCAVAFIVVAFLNIRAMLARYGVKERLLRTRAEWAVSSSMARRFVALFFMRSRDEPRVVTILYWMFVVVGGLMIAGMILMAIFFPH